MEVIAFPIREIVDLKDLGRQFEQLPAMLSAHVAPGFYYPMEPELWKQIDAGLVEIRIGGSLDEGGIVIRISEWLEQSTVTILGHKYQELYTVKVPKP